MKKFLVFEKLLIRNRNKKKEAECLFKLKNKDYILLSDITAITYSDLTGIQGDREIVIERNETKIPITIFFKNEEEAKEYISFIAKEVNKRRGI